ncbi:unnamed protein product [Paramecium primaurelia]|uniref:Uncharacterized protein n=1 Tax=Paramecium primaurelia TaxID=5886 RepID=A0A8S1JND4_PARPR|nr:unnamed protein product [Paramecium primaurelia]
MANSREQPLSKGDYHNRVPTHNYNKTIKTIYNDERKDLENYVQIPKKNKVHFETENQVRNNQQYYQDNNQFDDPFSNNPYYNKAALDKVCNRSIKTYIDKQNQVQDNNEQQRDNHNQNQQKYKQNEPISQYYNNEYRNRYQEIKNQYYNQNHQYKSILSPKVYSQDQFDQQEQQQIPLSKQQSNQQFKNKQANQSLYENPSFGLIQDQQQIYQQSQNQPIQQQFPYSQYPSQDQPSENKQKYIQNSTRQQYNNSNENYSQIEFQQQKQCTTYQTQSTQQQFQDLPIQKQQQFHQRLQYLEELKSRLPKYDIFQQQVDTRIPQNEQYYRQVQNERINKINPVPAVSRMQRPNEIDQDKYYQVQDHQNQYPQNNRNYLHQKRQDYQDIQFQHRNNSNQYINLYSSNQSNNIRENNNNQSYQRQNYQQQKTRTPNRYREDSYERDKQCFMQQTSHIHKNSQTINQRR